MGKAGRITAAKAQARAAEPKTKAKAKATLQAVATALERLEADENQDRPKPSRKLTREPTEETVKKKVANNFRGWNDYDLHCHLVDGASAWETLCADQHAKNLGFYDGTVGAK